MREQCQRVLHHAARCPRLVLTAAGIADIVGKKIAERIGIESIYYFSNLFKKQTGMSPTEYEKTLKE